MFINRLTLAIYCLTFYCIHVQAEIYQWVDAQGRMHFSDSPTQQYGTAGYSHQSTEGASVTSTGTPQYDAAKNLEVIAKRLKKDRLKRERARKKDITQRAQKNKKRERQLAAIKKKKLACQKAKDKEMLAFRQRTQAKSLLRMRKALANYEKKRESRREKCSR